MKKLCSWILTLAMVVGMLATSAFAYLEYVSEMDYMVPSNSYVKTDTVTGRNGEQHTVYIFPAGTTFTPRTMGSFALVIYAWTLDSVKQGTASYYDADYEAVGENAPAFVPEPGVVYLLEETNTMDWFQDMYIMVESGSAPVDPEPEQPEQVFSDVSPDAWYASFVQTVYEKGLFAGAGDGTFAPEANMTYAEFLTVLSQFSGETLTPVTGGAWYDTYVSWAREKELIPAGMAENFNPTAPITRQDMAALFGTFLGCYDHSNETVNSGQASYTDAGSIADYAQSGVQLCYQLGIMSGGSDGTFAPQATATRAQVAVTMVQMARVMGM